MKHSTQELARKLAVDPFGQTEFYFSESQRQIVSIEDMPLPYVRNVLNKLWNEHMEEFQDSPLQTALLARLCPDTRVLEEKLRAAGEASYYSPRSISRPTDENVVRSKFYRIAKRLGRKVHTERKGDFIVGTTKPDKVNVKIKGRRV